MTWSLDSNVLVDALRIPAAGVALEEFLAAGNRVVLSSVVAAELEFGARSPGAIERLEVGVVGLLLRRGEISAPDEKEWQRMGRLLGDHPEWVRTAGRQNDVLLASQCAERGWTLLTRDTDFGPIRRALPTLSLALPFPKPLPPSYPASRSRGT